MPASVWVIASCKEGHLQSGGWLYSQTSMSRIACVQYRFPIEQPLSNFQLYAHSSKVWQIFPRPSRRSPSLDSPRYTRQGHAPEHVICEMKSAQNRNFLPSSCIACMRRSRRAGRLATPSVKSFNVSGKLFPSSCQLDASETGWPAMNSTTRLQSIQKGRLLSRLQVDARQYAQITQK